MTVVVYTPHLEVASTSDGRRQATVTCSAIDSTGAFLVTCAHALLGPDGFAFTPNDIQMPASSTAPFVNVGKSGRVIQHPGSGMAGNFGVIDAGLVRLDSDSVIARVRQASPLMVRTSGIAARVRVVGHGGRTGVHHGFVRAIGLAAVAGNIPFADLLIESADGRGMTLPGDSGLMWRDEAGAALGMHAFGENQGPRVPSRFSVATLVARLPAALRVQLRQ